MPKRSSAWRESIIIGAWVTATAPLSSCLSTKGNSTSGFCKPPLNRISLLLHVEVTHGVQCSCSNNEDKTTDKNNRSLLESTLSISKSYNHFSYIPHLFARRDSAVRVDKISSDEDFMQIDNKNEHSSNVIVPRTEFESLQDATVNSITTLFKYSISIRKTSE